MGCAGYRVSQYERWEDKEGRGRAVYPILLVIFVLGTAHRRLSEPANRPCDVAKFSNTLMGVMGIHLFDWGRALWVKLTSTKRERLRTGESTMTHRMAITAFRIDAARRLVRYNVENLSEVGAGDQGFFAMIDWWFGEWVTAYP